MQCIDAGIEVITQVEEFLVFRREQIYAIYLGCKLFPNMTCDVNHCSFGPFEVADFGIFGIYCMVELNLAKVPYGYVQVRNLCAP